MSVLISAMVKAPCAISRVLLLIAFALSCCGQIYSQKESVTSSTYPQTLQTLSKWDGMGDDESADLATFFANGEGLAPDLLEACATSDEDIGPKAYLLLLLIGSDSTRECANRLHQEDPPAMLLTADHFSEADFGRLEHLFRPRACEDSGKCKEEDMPLIDESIVYGLVLDGSARAEKLLTRRSKLAKSSNSSDMLPFEVASHADALVAEARHAAHGLKPVPTSFEDVLRQSLFFLKSDVRQTAEIKPLARNIQDSRMLIAVSYTCGILCGSGYYIVLKKNDEGSWDYVLIVRAWIS